MGIGEERPLLSAREVSDDGSPRDSNGTAVAQEIDACSITDDPIEWPKSFKWVTIALLSFMAFTVYVLLSPPPAATCPNLLIADCDT